MQHVNLKLSWNTAGQDSWPIFATINATTEEYDQKCVSWEGSSFATQREIQGYLPSGFDFLGLVTQNLDMFNLFPLTYATVI